MRNVDFTLSYPGKMVSQRDDRSHHRSDEKLHSRGKKCSNSVKITLLAKSLIYIKLFTLSFGTCSAETLQQAWTTALSRNHTLAASQYKEQSAQHQVAAAEANYFPKVTLETGYLRTEYEPAAKLSIPSLPFLQGAALPFAQDSAYYGGVTISAPVFTSGKISSGVAAAKAMADASLAHTNLTRSELKLAIAQSYIAVLRAEHAVVVATSYTSAVSRHASDVQALFAHGYVAKHDLLQSANAQRPELQELSKQSEAYQQQASSVRAGHLPQIGVSGGYSKLENKYLAEDKGWWVGVVMKWNLFDAGLVRHQASELAANAQAVAEVAQDTRERIALQVRQSWLSHQEANARMQLVDKAVEQADESLALARERYRSGLGPNSEVLDAEASRLQACSNRDNAVYDRELSRLQLQYAAGSL